MKTALNSDLSFNEVGKEAESNSNAKIEKKKTKESNRRTARKNQTAQMTRKSANTKNIKHQSIYQH